MSRARSALPLAAAALAVLALVLVAPTAQADTSTTTSTTVTSPSSTSSTASSTSTSTSTTAPPAESTSTTVAGSTVAAPTPLQTITGASSGVPLFIVAGTPAPPPPGSPVPPPSVIQLTAIDQLASVVTDPSAELASAIEHFFVQGGVTAYLWLTSDEQASTLIAATTQLATSGTPADLFVIPSMSALDGQDYLNVAAALAALANGQLGVALLDPPTTVVTAVQAAWPDASALITLAGQLRTSVAVLGSAALYAAPLVDSSSGETVPASVVMAGMLAGQDENAGVWVPAAGTRITAMGLDVLVPFTNVQLATFSMEVNAFRDLPNYGTVMWGDRTLDMDSTEHKYLSVVRTADWIHRSISQGLAATVFEPNDQATQDAVDASVSPFLTATWKAGALFGATASQAFKLTFGLEPPPGQWSVGEGLWLHVELALVDPAEFQSFDLLVPTESG